MCVYIYTYAYVYLYAKSWMKNCVAAASPRPRLGNIHPNDCDLPRGFGASTNGFVGFSSMMSWRSKSSPTHSFAILL